MLWNQLGLQESYSPVMTQLTYFHDHSLLILTLIVTMISYATVSLLLNKFSSRTTLEAQEIETVWTILPAIILLFLALPSLRLLYLMDEINDSFLTTKVVGHQWYWSYEYSDFKNIEFDSYMIPTSSMSIGDYRLLEVDNRLIIPLNTEVRFMITAADVIHSWTIPSMGVKVDAVPGRLNQLSIFCIKPGVYYGQCSEICGANHSFMPISMEVINLKFFNKWILSFSSFKFSLKKM
uniref:Cytochrome c oxidase subunit 2 n=1 Tax=Streptosyllis sp. THS1 TaxID=1898410 RepID=A0A1C9UZA0_9ANNE|nr:cytochrome c oxidase subunit II [Streptosyllis sp. THS1]